MPQLFEPLRIREVRLRNRIVLSPMCTFAAGADGRAIDWHLVHLGARAVGGCGLILLEATAVESRGRISLADLGLWADDQTPPLARIVRFCKEQGAAVGVQLAHAGRKAWSPEKGRGPEAPVGPTEEPFAEGWVAPRRLDRSEVSRIVGSWKEAARRALEADFDVIEIHAAHGYLLHQFLSPLANGRDDPYGGTPAGRARILFEIIAAVRQVWPRERPLFLRVSATDWLEGGLTPEDWCGLAPTLKEAGIDLIDCSSGGIIPGSPPADRARWGYQIPFAEQIRREGGIATMAVGLITDPTEAEAILREGHADLVAVGRQMLRDPHWPLHAAAALGHGIEWPRPYESVRPRQAP